MKSVMKKTMAVGTLCTLLMGTAAYGTLAYFQEQETATNTFTSGNLTMDLTETHWAAPNTEGVTGEGHEIEDWNTTVVAYDGPWGVEKAANFVPGRTIPKNPTVAVAGGSVPAYVRMTLEVPAALYNVSNLDGEGEDDLVSFDINSSWEKINDKEGKANTRLLIYEYVTAEGEVQTIQPSEEAVALNPLFENVVISKSAQVEDIQDLGKDFNIVVNAYGVQAEEFSNVDEAFNTAFEGVFAPSTETPEGNEGTGATE